MRDFDLHSSIFEMFDQLAAKKKKIAWSDGNWKSESK